MPAKKRMLPKPCPICKRKNGTIQLVIFPNAVSKLVCRIGHYVSEEYSLPKEKMKQLEIDVIDTEKRNPKTRGKIWHNFTISPRSETKNRKLQKYLEKYNKSHNSIKKSITISPEPIFYELIKRTGWCMKPYKNYHGRKRRYSKYHFPKEEYYNLHDDKKHVTPD